MFIARQPIFDRIKNVYGYELLYRAGEGSKSYDGVSSETSTATVLGGLFELGIEQIVGNKKAFVNFDENFLLSDSIELIVSDHLVIEILENTNINDRLIHRIEYLKTKGYKIALDDFAHKFQDYPIMPFTDIIKYDITTTPLSTIEKDVKQALKQNIILLAEKIETAEEFQKAYDMGFHLFQGFFFSKPNIVGGLRSKKSTNTVYQRILCELYQPQPSYQKLTEIVETDVNMAYRVMKVSKKLSLEDRDKTIKNALTKMGLKEIERWVYILMLQNLSNTKPFELIQLSLIRTKFGELIAANSIFCDRKHEISLMCLFSVLDALLDQPMESALEGVGVSSDMKDALVLGKGTLMPIYNIMKAYECGRWDNTYTLAQSINLKHEKLSKLYMESLKWAENASEFL